MSLAATLLLLAASPAQPVVTEATASPHPQVAVKARAEIVRGEAVVFERAEKKRSHRTTVRTDADGVTWVEFS